MGILSTLLGGKKKKPSNINNKMTRSNSTDKLIARLEEQNKQADDELALLQEADQQFKIDNDIERRIAIYESVFRKKTNWNSFNYCMKLVKMYVDSGKTNKAWSLLNKILGWYTSYPNPATYVSKIRKEQFKILKKEKKYIEALRILLFAHCELIDSPSEFNVERFILEAKTTAKGFGMTEEQLRVLADAISKKIKKGDNAQQIDAVYQAFLAKQSLI